MGNSPLDDIEDDPTNDPFASGQAAAGDEAFEAEEQAEDEGLPPAGNIKYVAQVTSVSKEISKTSGNPMFKWETVLLSDVNGDTQFAGFEPKPIYTVLGAKAAWKMDAVLQALGCKPVDGKFKFTRDDVLGVLFLCELDEDEFNGRAQRNVGQMFPHPDGAGTKAAIAGPGDPNAPF